MSAAATPRRGRSAAALALMLASGFAGLGYQVVWTGQGALWLGHEAAAVLAVVTAFFGGLAAGAFLLGTRVERSAAPRRWYIACEATIAAWGLVLLAALPRASEALLALTGAQPAAWWQWSVAFFGSFLLFLPATAAMGATVPAMVRLLARADPAPGGPTLAAVYAANTAGAVLGVLAVAFWLVPALGLAAAAACCIALNGGCALLAWLAFAGDPAPPPAAPPGPAVARRAHLARLAATGLLGIGYEVMVVRILSQVTEDTVYTFAMLLAVYLVGTAAGAAAYRRRTARAPAPASSDRWLLSALALACVAGSAGLWGAERLRDAAVAAWPGQAFAAALGAEATLAIAAFGLPTVVMGALFSHLATRAAADGVGVGRAFGANTLGAAAAPVLFGVVLAPAWGAAWSLLAIALGYLALATPRTPRRIAAGLAVGALGGAAVGFAPPLAFVDLPEGGRVQRLAEGVLATVSVVEDAAGTATLRIDNRQQEGSSATRRVDARQALLPLLLHPAPRRALFLGMGTGVTAASAAADPAVQVDVVELLPEVIAASDRFIRGMPGPAAGRLHPVAADARRFVRTAAQRYDVIVSDNFHPARSGSGALYTVEHFRAVRERLAPGGLFCQWLPLHQLDLATLRSIVRSFLAVAPDATALLASNSLETPVLGLVLHAGPPRVRVGAVEARLAQAAAGPADPAAVGIEDDIALLGSFVAGPAALARFAGDAALNTDDHPVVAYAAPRATYAPPAPPRDRLLALLGEWQVGPDDVVEADTDAAFRRRLAAYWSARDAFIAAGRSVRPAADAAAMLAQVGGPLLAVLRTSPDFRPAYDPLLRLGQALAEDDPAAARALLGELARRQPERPEAAAALRDLAPPLP